MAAQNKKGVNMHSDPQSAYLALLALGYSPQEAQKVKDRISI